MSSEFGLFYERNDLSNRKIVTQRKATNIVL